MTQPQIAPYGSWKSPITTELLVSQSIGLGNGLFAGDSIYWLEGRPAEAGRNVLVQRRSDGTTHDVTPAPYNVRSRVHEYGGGAVWIAENNIYFVNFADQRLYRVAPDADPTAITPEAQLRYADGVFDAARNRFICVREDHTGAGEAVNTLTALTLDDRATPFPNDAQTVLVSGNDFYATPRLNPDGTRLTWLTWNHPYMPWDGTALWLATVQPEGTLTDAHCIAGGENESIFQPEWSPDGILYFVSDRSGWWNLYRWQNGASENLIEMTAEFGLPQWVFGMRTYAFESAQRIMCTYHQDGRDYLASLDTIHKTLTPIASPYTVIGGLQARPGQVLYRGGATTQPSVLVLLDLNTQESPLTGFTNNDANSSAPPRQVLKKGLGDEVHILKQSSTLTLDSGYLSAPQALTFPTDNHLTAHALFYPPQNQDFVAPDSAKPPLLVLSHGGPTGATSSALNLRIQYWTSRGFAILDVNYGGSTGYGRAYRERLNGQWGIVDVNDCVNGARYLVQQGWVDAERLAIRGGSAGGYTTLCALTYHDIFQAGASHYGVSDLQALALETHKFESRYLDRLVGPYPERRDLYQARSPIHHIAGLNCPVIFFQGLEDQVVPPAQAETMVNALREKGIPVAYIPFEGEQHGFRRAANIQRALDAELYFYGRIFGFELATPVTPVTIENLSS